MKHWLTPFHLLCYYIAWFSCILSAASNNSWLGTLVTLPIIILQWNVQRYFTQTNGVLMFITLTCLFGILIDSFLLHLGFIHFSANPWPGVMSPPWMISLWASLAILSYFCLHQFFKYYLLSGIFSAIGFPIAYYAGVKLHAATLHSTIESLVTLGFCTGLAIPLLLWIFNTLRKNP